MASVLVLGPEVVAHYAAFLRDLFGGRGSSFLFLYFSKRYPMYEVVKALAAVIMIVPINFSIKVTKEIDTPVHRILRDPIRPKHIPGKNVLNFSVILVLTNRMNVSHKLVPISLKL